MAFHPQRATRVENGQLASDDSYGANGCFVLPSPEPGWDLVFIASDGMGWEHVSVRADNGKGRTRVPTWKEMCAVKATCWDGDDVVMQLHPREAEYVNCHPSVLHLWRPTDVEIPTPDPVMV